MRSAPVRQLTSHPEQPKVSDILDRTEASCTVVGVGLFNLGLCVHDKGTARNDCLVQWTTSIEQSPQGFVLRSDRHLGFLPAFAMREPNDVARCYEVGLSADGALALQDDNDCVELEGDPGEPTRRGLRSGSFPARTRSTR
jgi:hypothetical protein